MAKDYSKLDYADMKDGKAWAWLTVVGLGFMIAFTLQTIMSGAGNFMMPVTTELGIPLTDFTWWLTMYSIGMCVANLVWAGRVWVKVNARVLMTVCCGVPILLMMCMSFFNYLWQWIVAGLLIGAFGGTVFMLATPFLCNNWFAKIPGTAMGVAGIVTAVLFAIMNPVDAMIVQNFGWRSAYLIIGVISLVCTLPWCLFVFRFDPREKGMRPVGWEPGMAENVAAAEGAPGMTGKEALKTVAFWGVFIGTGICSLFGGYQGLYSPIAQGWGYDITSAALLMSAASIANALGPVWGILCDKLGAFKTAIIAMIATLIGCFGLFVIHAPLFLVCVLVIIFSSMNPVVGQISPLMMREAFGPKDLTKITGWLQVSFGTIGAFSSPLLANAPAWFGHAGDLNYTFMLGLIMGIIVLVLYIFAFIGSKKLKWDEEE